MKLSNKSYDIIKWIVLLFLPGIETLIHAIGAIWHLPYTDEISKTVNALALFLGIITGISTINYNKENKENGDVDNE